MREGHGKALDTVEKLEQSTDKQRLKFNSLDDLF